MGVDMTDPNLPSRVPSEAAELLRSLIGQRLVKLVRYSWWPGAQVAQECGSAPSAAFSLTAGPLAMTFENGLTLGLASEPSLASVIVWQDRDVGGRAIREPTLDHDSELFPIDAADSEFSQPHWARLLNATLSGVSVLRRRPVNSLHADLPREVGLCLRFEGGLELLAAHGLHDDSDDFAVVTLDQIAPALRSELESHALRGPSA
jgi:hypothetical protein